MQFNHKSNRNILTPVFSISITRIFKIIIFIIYEFGHIYIDTLWGWRLMGIDMSLYN